MTRSKCVRASFQGRIILGGQEGKWVVLMVFLYVLCLDYTFPLNGDLEQLKIISLSPFSPLQSPVRLASLSVRYWPKVTQQAALPEAGI